MAAFLSGRRELKKTNYSLILIHPFTFYPIFRGALYVINRDDELIVKRIQDLWNGQIKIKSDNPKYEPLIIQKTDAIKIVGEVVWIGQKK